MSDRATCWSVTINNPVESDEEHINSARQKGWKVDGQLEKGEKDGTPHYQLIVRTPQVRFSAVKKAFPRAHIEIARNPTALASYCKKEDTREASLPDRSSLYPSQDQVLNMFVAWVRVQQDRPNMDKEGYTIKADGETWLIYFDKWVNDVAIGKHFLRIETMAVNPATRSAIKRYMNGIYQRHMKEQNAKTMAEMDADSQTDRQTVTFSVAEDIQDGTEEVNEENDPEAESEVSSQESDTDSEGGSESSDLSSSRD